MSLVRLPVAAALRSPTLRVAAGPSLALVVWNAAAVVAGVPIGESLVCVAVGAVLLRAALQRPLLTEPARWPKRRLALAAVSVAAGWLFQSWLLIALGGMHVARSGLTRWFADADRATLRPWWPVAVMTVPWVWADGWWLGWEMRLSAASTAAALVAPFLDGVSQQGTSILVDRVRIDVAASCAGLGLLQATLTLGLAAAAYATRSAAKTVLAAPLLVAIAWAANVARVIALTLVAVLGSPELASSTLHDAIGYGSLGLLAWGGWSLLDRCVAQTGGDAAAATGAA